MSPITVEEAQAHLPELVELAAAGREIVIESQGGSMAKLVPVEPGPLDFEAWATMDDELFGTGADKRFPPLMALDFSRR